MEAVGIDIGTTSICGVAIDTDTGAVLRVVSRDSNAFIKTEREYEKIQSVEKIFSLTLEIMHSLVTEECRVIGVTGQMHGIVYTDKNGRAVSDLYTWQDGRGNLEYKKGLTYAKYLNSYTGYGIVTDLYNRENSLRPAEAESFCTIQDHIVMGLCGNKKPLVHTSDAASLGGFDLKNKKCNYDGGFDLVDGYVLAGEYKGIPVAVAIGDNQASVLSTTTKDDVLINIGTGSQVSVICDGIINGDNIETRPYFEDKYLAVGAALCGGRAYALLKEFYKGIFAYNTPLSDGEVYEIMGRMAKKGASPLTVDTRFSGTRQNAEIKGAISGITTENFTPEGLTSGVLGGIIDELYSMYSIMGVSKKGLVGSGNGIRKNNYLIETAEKTLGLKMKIPLHNEEAAVGAAMYASICAGIYENMETASNVVVKYS